MIIKKANRFEIYWLRSKEKVTKIRPLHLGFYNLLRLPATLSNN